MAMTFPDNDALDARMLNSVRKAPGSTAEQLREAISGATLQHLVRSLGRLAEKGDIRVSSYSGGARYYPAASGRATLEARRANMNALLAEQQARRPYGTVPPRTFTNADPDLPVWKPPKFMDPHRPGAQDFLKLASVGVR